MSTRPAGGLGAGISGSVAWAGVYNSLPAHDELFIKLYDRLPKEMLCMRELTLSALWRTPEHWEVASESNGT